MFQLWCILLLAPGVELLSSGVQCVKYDSSAKSGHQLNENCTEMSEGIEVPKDLCFTIWQNRSDPSSSHSSGLTVHMQGCIASLGWGLKSYEACRREECIETAGVKEKDNRMLFCCCNTAGCNRNFEWKPRGKETRTTVKPTKHPDRPQDRQQENNQSSHPSSGDNLVIYLLGCIGLVCVICIVLLVGCLAVVNKKKKCSCHSHIGRLSSVPPPPLSASSYQKKRNMI